jgi:hypothetical protein
MVYYAYVRAGDQQKPIVGRELANEASYLPRQRPICIVSSRDHPENLPYSQTGVAPLCVGFSSPEHGYRQRGVTRVVCQTLEARIE